MEIVAEPAAFDAPPFDGGTLLALDNDSGAFIQTHEATAPLALYRKMERLLGVDESAARLGLHKGTLRRWRETNRVPPAYVRDIERILRGASVATGSPAPRDVDAFYTKPAVGESCIAMLNETMVGTLGVNPDDYHFIDPSAGSGCFYNVLPSDRRTGIDIVPHQGMVYQDYLAWRPREGLRCVVVGNPPFGLRGHLALKFINHSAGFADVVGFILPQLFESDGKGAASKRVDSRYALAISEPLPPNSFQYPDGRDVEVATVFQVWTKVGRERIAPASRPDVSDYVRVYSLSDGGTPSSTRNKAMLYKCDVYLPSTCYNGMRAYDKFDELPHRRGYGVVAKQCASEIAPLLRSADWENVAFRSTNGALNLRTSLIEGVVAAGGFRR